MIGSVVFMLIVLLPRSMQTGFSIKKLDSLKNENPEKLLELEVGANFYAVETNEKIVKKQQNYFKIGLFLAIFSVVVSTTLLLINLLII